VDDIPSLTFHIHDSMTKGLDAETWTVDYDTSLLYSKGDFHMTGVRRSAKNFP